MKTIRLAVMTALLVVGLGACTGMEVEHGENKTLSVTFTEPVNLFEDRKTTAEFNCTFKCVPVEKGDVK